MIHTITKNDAEKIALAAKTGACEVLGLPEMATAPWSFERDYPMAVMWANFCLEYVFPKEAAHVVLGWMREDGTRELLRRPEVYTEAGFDKFVGFAGRNKFLSVYAVHAK
jgi:hypothetical protein